MNTDIGTYFNEDRTGFFLAVVRVIIALMFLWAFADKLFGLGFPTPSDMGYIDGGSPTKDFLAANDGWFAPLFNAMANIYQITDVLIIVGLLLIGGSLLIGTASKITTVASLVLLTMFYMSELPLADNPILDFRLVYMAALAAAYFGNGFGRISLKGRWDELEVVKKHPILG